MILSAGVVVIRQDNHGNWLYLLLRCFNYWDFPKGMVESGEAALDAAVREVREETTIIDLAFNWGYEYIETGPYKGGSKMARYYIATTKQQLIELPINPELGRAEHEEYCWMDYKAANAALSPRVKRVLRWARNKLSDG